MERMSGQPHYRQLSQIVPRLNGQIVESLFGAGATRHVLYLLDGQYLYGQQAEDGSIYYKFLSAQSIRLAFSGEPVDSGWLQPGVRRWGYGQSGHWAVLFMPPTRHTLWLPSEVVVTTALPPLRADENVGDEVTRAEQPTHLANVGGLVAVKVWLPGLVFVGIGQNYYLWAIKEAEFTPQATAYHAPLPNVYPDGRICWGNNRVEPVTPQNVVAAWQLFISSPFNTHLAAGKSRRYSQNILDGLGRPATGSKRRGYPVRDLLPLKNGWEREGVTVERLVERLTGGRWRD